MLDEKTTHAPTLTPAELKAVIEAERTGIPFVHWRDADGSHRILMLDVDRWRITIGRRSDSEIALTEDLEVSRAHALLERVSGPWTVVDDGLSRNGTFVNGKRVVGRQRLHDRDRLCFGRTAVIYREPPGEDGSISTERARGPAIAATLSETQRKVLIALCRPVNDSAFAPPATNKEIAEEVFLSVDAVKAHLRVMFERFELGELPQNAKRAQLAARMLLDGVIKPHEF